MATTLMGWNQVVWLTDSNKALKVSEFSLGIKQSFNVPDLITGLTDAITWSKGTVEVTGRLSAPLTQSFSTSLLAKGLIDPSSGLLDEVWLKASVCDEIEAKINSIDISATAGEAITSTIELFGRLSVGTDYVSNWGKDKDDQTLMLFESTGTSLSDEARNAALASFELEEVPMFDRVLNADSFLPQETTQSACQVTKIDLKIENNLKRNYVLGSETLNCYSISAGQRKLTGSVTYISGGDGQLNYVVRAGLGGMALKKVYFGPVSIDLSTGTKILFEATPPSLRPSDVISLSSNFQILSDSYKLIDITIE